MLYETRKNKDLTKSIIAVEDLSRDLGLNYNERGNNHFKDNKIWKRK
jgi:hypothetical protein